jgi:hypothetical protein
MTQKTFPQNSYHPIVADYISKFKSGELTFEIIAQQFPDKIETFDENNFLSIFRPIIFICEIYLDTII